MLFRMSLNKEMKNKFNIGDRVRFTRKDCHWIEISIDNGDEGVVVGNGSGYFHNSVEVNFGGVSDEISADYLELIEPYDPKTAFLSDLADVLRKHNAVINVSWNNSWQADDAKYPLIDMDILFNDSVTGISFEDVLGKALTANNIMDYDKE